MTTKKKAMKKLVIEAYSLDTPYVGVGEFCSKLLTGLVRQSKWLRKEYGIELYFIVSPGNKGILGNDVRYITLRRQKKWIFRFFPCKATLYYAPHQYCHCIKVFRAKKKLMTVHDVNFFYEKNGQKLQRAINRFQTKIDKVDYINYISNFSREDTERNFHIPKNKSCGVIYNGVTDLSGMVPDNPGLNVDIPEKFMLHISSLLPKKNVHLLIEMMNYLPERNLIIVGDWKHPYGQENIRKIDHAVHGNIIYLNNITEEQKAYLFSRCEAFLFPSLCEGFGLPPIEAMKFGKPVFLSTLTSLPEIGSDVAFYWPELDPQEMAEIVNKKMDLFYSQPDYPERIKNNARRFNWDQCVSEYTNLLVKLLTAQTHKNE